MKRLEAGQLIGEYALIWGLISLIVITAVTLLGQEVGNMFCEWMGPYAKWIGFCSSYPF